MIGRLAIAILACLFATTVSAATIVTRGATSARGYGYGSSAAAPVASYFLTNISNSGSGNVQANSIAVDSLGNIYVEGAFSNSSANNISITKLTSSGASTWDVRLGSSSANMNFGSILVDGSGNAWSGFQDGLVSPNRAALVELNTTGTSLTVQNNYTNGSSTATSIRAIAFDSSGNLIVAGISNGIGFIGKFDTTGAQVWGETLGTSGAPGTMSNLYVDGSDNIYAVGASTGGAGSNDIYIVKTNSSGTIQWQRLLGGTGSDNGGAVTVDGSGNVYVGGTASISSVTDIVISKWDSSGTSQWQRSLVGAGTGFVGSLSISPSGNIFLAGHTVPVSGRSAIMASHDSTGAIQFQQTWSKTSVNVTLLGIKNITNSNYFMAVGQAPAPTTQSQMLSVLPLTGLKTGTYNSLVLANSTLVDAASTLTVTTPTFTATSETWTPHTTTYTLTNSLATVTTTTIP